MDYTSLEEAYGSPFQQRAPITHQRKDALEKPIAKNSAPSAQSVVDSIAASLPLDSNPVTENFRVEQKMAPRTTLREQFTGSQPANMVMDFDQSEKISRILRLIEQNKTGYERPAVQDMVLYIATGIFFLFTFDTFVMLGKSMRGK
jgi:hypothetical protein